MSGEDLCDTETKITCHACGTAIDDIAFVSGHFKTGGEGDWWRTVCVKMYGHTRGHLSDSCYAEKRYLGGDSESQTHGDARSSRVKKSSSGKHSWKDWERNVKDIEAR